MMTNVCYALMILFAAIAIRIFILLYKIISGDSHFKSDNKQIRTLICIGSGGHTTEMLRLLTYLNTEKYIPRLYILADNDLRSEVKIIKQESVASYALCRIPRSRNIHQSYLSSIFTTIYATLNTLPAVYKFKPNLILCNGPGTCIPVCVVAFLFRCFFIINCRIVFIESLCRVRTLSLSGKILQFIADEFIVQWPQLQENCSRAKYFGRLA